MVRIIDRETVVTGSFNFKKPAKEKNAEILVVIMDKALDVRYMENWKEHKQAFGALYGKRPMRQLHDQLL